MSKPEADSKTNLHRYIPQRRQRSQTTAPTKIYRSGQSTLSLEIATARKRMAHSWPTRRRPKCKLPSKFWAIASACHRQVSKTENIFTFLSTAPPVIRKSSKYFWAKSSRAEKCRHTNKGYAKMIITAWGKWVRTCQMTSGSGRNVLMIIFAVATAMTEVKCRSRFL